MGKNYASSSMRRMRFSAAYYKVLKIISEETRLVGWEFLV